MAWTMVRRWQLIRFVFVKSSQGIKSVLEESKLMHCHTIFYLGGMSSCLRMSEFTKFTKLPHFISKLFLTTMLDSASKNRLTIYSNYLGKTILRSDNHDCTQSVSTLRDKLSKCCFNGGTATR